MKVYQAEHSIKLMCRVLHLSRSGYYAWLKKQKSDWEKRNDELTEEIRSIHLESKGIYGAPRIHAQLQHKGIKTSRKRVARLMSELGICGVTRRKKWKTTKRNQDDRPAPDLVDRQFKAENPDQLWVADITHIPTKSKPVYLAVVIDVWSRKVVGWSIDSRMPTQLVIDALDMALKRRKPMKDVIHHSDQGSQYTSKDFKVFCAQSGIKVSMGSVGDCYDNALAESFFAILETELLDLVPKFSNFEDTQQHVISFIEGFYNTRRLHSKLNHQSPVDFEKEMTLHSSQATLNHYQGMSTKVG